MSTVRVTTIRAAIITSFDRLGVVADEIQQRLNDWYAKIRQLTSPQWPRKRDDTLQSSDEYRIQEPEREDERPLVLGDLQL